MNASSVEPAPVRPLPRWVIVIAVGLTGLFWRTLWLGGGLVGGDVYSYSLPQKVYLADALRAGSFPLWNNRVGFGYPVLGESQTAALYPLHLLAYGVLDVHTAWNAVLLVHYIATFLAALWCARQLGLSVSGAVLAAVVYVYGWFPQRAFLDWAILGGLYLPLALGCASTYFRTRWVSHAVGLSLAIGLQLLGGHYQIAFLTWLLLVAYVAARWWSTRAGESTIDFADNAPPASSAPAKRRWWSEPALILTAAFVLGIGLAAVQLLPTWELKSISQRASVGGEHDPGYGHIPPAYLSQIVLPWVWYDPGIDLDAAIGKLNWLAIRSGTNRVEAHLYFGQVPFYLALWYVVGALRTDSRRRAAAFWLTVMLLSLIYCTGWLMPLLGSVPGFNFFRGPGRAGIIATLAVAFLAGAGLGELRRRLSPFWASRLAVLIVAVTVADLWWLPRTVSYAVAVSQPPIAYRDLSRIRQALLREPAPPRLYAPGANLPTLLGVSAVPVYLGLGPREYFDPDLMLPPADPDDFHTYTPERLAWLRRSGVTHMLSFQPLEPLGWPADPVWAGFDPLLNTAWARFDAPVFLYRLREVSGRVSWEDAGDEATATIESLSPNTVKVIAASRDGGRLVLTDLSFPGWQVAVDGQVVPNPPTSGMFRAVELSPGRHEVVWSYRPASVYWGAGLSGLAALLLGLGSLALSRHPAE